MFIAPISACDLLLLEAVDVNIDCTADLPMETTFSFFMLVAFIEDFPADLDEVFLLLLAIALEAIDFAAVFLLLADFVLEAAEEVFFAAVFFAALFIGFAEVLAICGLARLSEAPEEEPLGFIIIFDESIFAEVITGLVGVMASLLMVFSLG
jgi:hypothetical protein